MSTSYCHLQFLNHLTTYWLVMRACVICVKLCKYVRSMLACFTFQLDCALKRKGFTSTSKFILKKGTLCVFVCIPLFYLGHFSLVIGNLLLDRDLAFVPMHIWKRTSVSTKVRALYCLDHLYRVLFHLNDKNYKQSAAFHI